LSHEGRCWYQHTLTIVHHNISKQLQQIACHHCHL
jgi:hypothetical protein